MVPSPVAVGGRDIIRRRILAYIADAVAIIGGIGAVQSVRGRSSERNIAITIAISGILAAPYHVLLEGTTGQTLGKKLLRIAVVRENGKPCTYRGAAIRTVFRFIDWLPVAYLVGLTSMVVTERQQRLGDLAAGTVVVRDERRLDEPRGQD